MIKAFFFISSFLVSIDFLILFCSFLVLTCFCLSVDAVLLDIKFINSFPFFYVNTCIVI